MTEGDRVAANEATAKIGKVKGRFAPTPSGRMHLGNVFSCLMAWLGARSAGGTVLLRIEDLDPRAQDPKKADLLMRDLEWLGLVWDEGPYFQSKRTEVYLEAIKELGRQGLTYPCFCTRAELHAATAPHASDGTYLYAGTCCDLTPEQVAQKSLVRPPATRLRVPSANDPQGTIEFNDLVFGPRKETLAEECGDFLVRRSDGVVAYQLAVAVDDGLMGVTQVVRGHDLLTSTARQLYIARRLGLPQATYGHVPLLTAPDGRRLSQRDQDLDLGILRESGVSAEKIIGSLAAAAGLVPHETQVPASDLVNIFSWDALAAHREDIVVSGDFLA